MIIIFTHHNIENPQSKNRAIEYTGVHNIEYVAAFERLVLYTNPNYTCQEFISGNYEDGSNFEQQYNQTIGSNVHTYYNVTTLTILNE